MKKVQVALLAFFILSQSLMAQTDSLMTDLSKGGSQLEARVKVKRGVYVNLEVDQDFSSADLSVGSSVPLFVTKPVVVDGVKIIAEGAEAIAVVHEVQRAKRFGRSGRLVLKIIHVRTINERDLPLRTDILPTGISKSKNLRAWTWALSAAAVGGTTSIMTLGVTGVVLGVPCLVVGFGVKGNEAVIKKGTRYSATTAEPFEGAGPKVASAVYDEGK